ncbi:hypothetical protein [Nocardioides daphniae]|uniref:Uncharacterized protein n=1 Tax=Nocardioides daphniae TaxID=402297 RepID=A0A4P7UJF6_9ACTN|nr:hypothetical protein [Nocardioides daphniae]QCC78499.1 hypothetical protein E2C04_17160 [Nocardioides daphniae]GGD11923.1 hypothetical protein GCM10007231_08510 [Nocardioides daphniae]
MSAHPAIAPLRILLVVALLSVMGFLGWASTWPEDEGDDSNRVAVPTAPQPLEESVGEPKSDDGAQDGAEGDGEDVAIGNPRADTIPATGALGDYQVPIDAGKKLLRVVERIRYLDGYSDGDRLKHAIVVCEKVAFQGWTWQQQVAGDVAFEVPDRTASRFAEHLEVEFCPAVRLVPDAPEEPELPEDEDVVLP